MQDNAQRMIRHLRQLSVAASWSPGDLIGRHTQTVKPHEQTHSSGYEYVNKLGQLDIDSSRSINVETG